MNKWFIVLACCVGAFFYRSPLCVAGIRAPGKYCGVAVFDRWDGCTLYSGIYVMYVSEKTKEGLRKYAGQAVQIDTKEVYQPGNPGDGLIGKFEYLGPAPENRNWVKLTGIRLASSVKVGDDGKAIATLIIENRGDVPVKLFSQELALTLLTKKRDGAERNKWSVSDGPSVALITRQSFEIGGSEPRWEGNGFDEVGKPYAWTIGKEKALPHDFTLAPKDKRQIDVQLDLPDGQYDFLCGYGGGVHESKCLASNLSAFDVKNGKATVVIFDPIDRLAADFSASHGLWENGIYPILSLPETALPEQVIKRIFEMWGFDKGKVTSYKILKIQQVHIQGSLPDLYTVALVQTNFGEKIILFKYVSGGWWNRVCDAKTSD